MVHSALNLLQYGASRWLNSLLNLMFLQPLPLLPQLQWLQQHGSMHLTAATGGHKVVPAVRQDYVQVSGCIACSSAVQMLRVFVFTPAPLALRTFAPAGGDSCQ